MPTVLSLDEIKHFYNVNNHTMVLLATSNETFSMAQAFRVKGTFSSGTYRLPMFGAHKKLEICYEIFL